MSVEIAIEAGPAKLAYSVDEVLRLVPFGRNKLYDEARAGRLPMRKLGRSSLILAEDLQTYLRSLPVIS